MKTLDLNQAAELLKLHPQTVLQRSRAGEIPAAKPGKCWVYIEEDLLNWLRSFYGSPRRNEQAHPLPEATCYTKERQARSGGSDSPRPMDTKYAALLAPRTKGRPKNLKQNSGTTYGDNPG
jgi:hypothetical protein